MRHDPNEHECCLVTAAGVAAAQLENSVSPAVQHSSRRRCSVAVSGCSGGGEGRAANLGGR